MSVFTPCLMFLYPCNTLHCVLQIHVIAAFLNQTFPSYIGMYVSIFVKCFNRPVYSLVIIFDSAVCSRPPFRHQIIKIPYSYDFLTSASAWFLIIAHPTNTRNENPYYYHSSCLDLLLCNSSIILIYARLMMMTHGLTEVLNNNKYLPETEP